MFLKVVYQKNAWCLALILGGLATQASARPQFGTVIDGSATIQQDKKLTQVIQDTELAHIEWATFSVGEGETCEFFVPQPSSHTFNLVTGTQFSEIAGKIKSNGHLTLVNPAGIIFKEGSSVDVNGLLAASIPLVSYRDNQAHFSGNQGAIYHQGDIHSQGDIAFIAPYILDEGVVYSEGKITYAMTTDASYNFLTGILTLNAQAPEGATFLRKTGSVTGKTVWMDAFQREGNKTSIINIDGVVQAKDITITADHIVLNGRTHLDANVETGVAGSIRVGGEYKGKGELPRAKTVTFEPGAAMTADATKNGHGGRIIVWSDVASNLHGYISAQGGDKGGDGGFVETSSESLLYTASLEVSTLAPYGTAGVWLMDPATYTISESMSPEPNHYSLVDLRKALSQSNVVIRTSGSLPGEGDIIVDGNLQWNSSNTLTLEAARHIDLSHSSVDEKTRQKLVLIPNVLGGYGHVKDPLMIVD